MVQHVGVFAGSLPHTEAHSADDRVAHARVRALIAVGEPGGNAAVDGGSVGNAERGHIALGGVIEGPEAHDRGDLRFLFFFPNLRETGFDEACGSEPGFEIPGVIGRG